jgi:hypothetical protein
MTSPPVVSFAEKAVLGHFVLLVILWLSKEPAKGYVDGWASLWFIKEGYEVSGHIVD